MNIHKHGDGLKLSLTKDDFDFEFFTAGGHGGQNVQKTSTACRCSHRPSGAVGISRDERSQPQNKRNAFERCTKSDKFRLWAKTELARQEARVMDRPSVEQQVNAELSESNLLVHVHDDHGNWVKADKLTD